MLAEPTLAPVPTERTARARDVIDAARVLLDTEGPGALTMRRLADDVGMRAPSLYKHVRDKASLESALIEDLLFEVGEVLHAAIAKPGRRGAVRALLATYREQALSHPNRYRLATSGPLRRDLLPDYLEEWAGQPFYLVTGDPHRSQALWSFAHGMVILEIDGRFPDDSDLDHTWRAGAEAFDAR